MADKNIYFFKCLKQIPHIISAQVTSSLQTVIQSLEKTLIKKSTFCLRDSTNKVLHVIKHAIFQTHKSYLRSGPLLMEIMQVQSSDPAS